MHSIRRRLSIILILCIIAATILTSLFVNITINNKFNKYMVDTQNKRYERIVDYLQEIYERDGQWTRTSGSEMMHDAFMNNYCLTLLDKSKKVVWGMDPNDILQRIHMNTMMTQTTGVYNSKTFDIKVGDQIVGYVDIGQYSSVLLTEDDVNFKLSVYKSILASGLLTLFITIIISLYISKQFSNPIKRISNISVDLSNGRFDSSYNRQSSIMELEDLRTSINTLAAKLKHQDTLRKRLVADISHEIRTPLNVLQNNLEAMIDGVFPVTDERLNDLNDEVIRFGKLLDNLNALKQFEVERIPVNLEEVSLHEILDSVCRDFSVISREKNIEFLYEAEDSEESNIRGDKDKLRQVFINLLSNAVKFTNSGGQIWAKLYSFEDKVVVEIRDTGIGIKKGDLPFVFERLYRGDKSRQAIEGMGIGLTLVRNILQLHSAEIDIESEEGKGTTVKVYFEKINEYNNDSFK